MFTMFSNRDVMHTISVEMSYALFLVGAFRNKPGTANVGAMSQAQNAQMF